MVKIKQRRSLFYILGIIFVLTLSAVIFIVRNQTNNIINDLTLDRVQLANRSFANYLTELEGRLLLRAEVIANNEAVIAAVKNKDQSALRRYLINFSSGMDFTSICDEQGIVLARSHNNLTGDDISGYDGIAKALKGEFSASIDQIRSNRDQLSIYASIPIFSEENVIGVITCNFDLFRNEYVDMFKAQTGCEATIFLYDERISTTIRDDENQRVTGSKAYGFITEAVIVRQEEYLGNLELYGRMYGVCYSPLIVNEKTIGMLFTGVDIDHTIESQNVMNNWILIAAIIGIVVSVVFITISNRIIGRLEERAFIVENEKQKAESASRAKGDFLSTMSHEMRTPMNAIIGMALMARNTPDEERKKYALHRIEEASKHLLGIINDVLDMSRIEAQKLELSYVAFDLNDLLQKSVSFVRYSMDVKRQKFSMKVGDTVPSSFIGDDQRLSQVIINLLSNAVKFTPEDGEISLSIEMVCEGELEGKKHCELRFEVTDSGIGITPDQQEKIFFMFEQAESGTTRKFGGTGLGLSISRHIVNLMNGSIFVESEPGKGSRFIFTVKLEQTEGGASKSPASNNTGIQKNEFAGKKILLAEDIEINREIFMSLLEDTGIEIDIAEDGKTALDKYILNPKRYDLIIMDVQMPGMDGIEASRRIRTFEEESLQEFAKQKELPLEFTPQLSERRNGVPIIAITANVFKDDIDKCLSAGMNDHIGKPLEIETVFSKLRKYLHP